MTQFFRTLVTLCAVIAMSALLTVGCRKATEPPTGPDIQGGQPMIPGSAGIISIKAISELGNAGDFEMDLFLTDSSGNPLDNLSGSNLSILAGLDTAFSKVDLSQATCAAAGPFSAELLVDQSNSMAYNDPLNLRLKAARIFMDGVTALRGGQDEVQLSTFYSIWDGGLMSYGPFTHNGMAFDHTIDNLAGRLGPGTPLYDAIYAETDSLANSGTNANKALIVFTDGDDNESSHSLWESIDHAKSLGIKVFAVALKTGKDLDSMASPEAEHALFNIAMNTGGAAMHTADPVQAVAYYSGLSKLIHGGVGYFQTKWHVTLPKDASLAGQQVKGTLQVTNPSGPTITAPFVVTF